VDLLLSMAGIEKIGCANRGTANFRLPPMPAELFAWNPDHYFHPTLGTKSLLKKSRS
jgi:hypothetical protein